MNGDASDFGDLLRRYRVAAGLTQEGLAERAGLSVHGVQKLERGTTRPYRDTAQRLIAALQLGGTDEARVRTAAQPSPRRRASGTYADPTASSLPRHNLPIPVTTFIAREGELAQLAQATHANRLLTITGSGGCGKTRLALELSRGLVESFADGVWLIDFTPLIDAGLLAQTIASALGVREAPGRPHLDALIDHLRSRRILLVLDNCEHVIDVCASVVQALVESCGQVHVLTTSRELLGIAGEATWRVMPLSVVDSRGPTTVDAEFIAAVQASEAAQLFLDRARLVAPSFAITGGNALAVAQICQRLDGIPLAIELAAARLGMLSAEQIAARLDQRFRLLTGGKRTATRRQQTLEAAVDWSYQLLAEDERALLRRLAVFAGGWSLEAAEALGSDLAATAPLDVFDVLSRLVSKSMVVVDMAGAADSESLGPRYRFLETIRQYAEQKLADSGEAEAIRARHRDWYVDLVDQAIDGMESAEQKRWWARLELELDNLRVALGWSAADPDGSDALVRLAGGLGRFWMVRGFAQEGISWLELALQSNQSRPSAARARALNWLGLLETGGGNHARASVLLEESIAQARAVGEQRVLSLALRHLGTALTADGEYARAGALLEEALRVSHEAGVAREIAWNLQSLAAHRALVEPTASIEAMLLESVAIGRESGDLTPVISAEWALGRLYFARGDAARARRMVNEALTLVREIDARSLLAGALATLGDFALSEGDWAAALDWYRQDLSASLELGTPGSMAFALRRYAGLCGARGDHREVVRIFGAASSAPDTAGTVLVNGPSREKELLAAARQALTEEEFAWAWAHGRSLTLEQAVAGILDEREATTGGEPTSPVIDA